MRNSRKRMRTLGIIIMSIAILGSAIPVYAAPDWGQIPDTETGSSQINAQKMQCAFDEKNLYLHITGGESNTWDSLPQLQIAINQTPLEGVLSSLILTCDNIPEEGEAVVSVKDNQWRERVTGTLTRSNRINEIDITIPFLGLGYNGKDVSEVSVSVLVDGNKDGECNGVFVGQEQPEESEEPVKKNIVVDGEFSDWDGYDLVYVNTNGMNMISMTCDGTNLYIRVIEDGSYDFSFPWRETTLGVTSNMGKVLWLNPQLSGENESASLTFLGIEGSYGRCGRVDGVYNWELSIPLTEIWSGITYVSEISLISRQNTSDSIITVSNPSYVDRGETGGDLSVGSDITIDGYYEDWSSIPHTEITFGDRDKANNHIGTVYLGEDYMYVHYKLNRLFTSHIRVDYMELKINGTRYILKVLPVDEAGNYDSNRENQIQSLGEGIYTDYGVFLCDVPNAQNYDNNMNGQAAITIYANPRTEQTLGDEVEFSMSYDRLEELTGIKRSEIRKVELYNPHLGDQWITCVGTSSGPLIGVGISVVAAIGLYYVLTRRNKRKEEIA